MLRVICDTCSADLDRDRDKPGWFGIDHAHLDVDGELVQFEDSHRFHFCSPDHAIAWLMERSYVPRPSEGSTT